jgi:RIO kinase 1
MDTDDVEFKGKPWNPDQDKYFSGVFGHKTMMALYKLATKGYITEMGGEISRGKEAAIFTSTTKDGKTVILKIFKPMPSFDMMKYVKGDPRIRGFRKNNLVEVWAKKEFKNLSRFMHLGIRVPEPLFVLNNVLVMEFIGADHEPARTFREHPPEDAAVSFTKIKEYLKRSYEGGIVHGDLSEYNILNYKDEPVIIDCSAAVIRKHPRFKEFLARDIHNIVKFFNRLRVDCSEQEVTEYVLSGDTQR